MVARLADEPGHSRMKHASRGWREACALGRTSRRVTDVIGGSLFKTVGWRIWARSVQDARTEGVAMTHDDGTATRLQAELRYVRDRFNRCRSMSRERTVASTYAQGSTFTTHLPAAALAMAGQL